MAAACLPLTKLVLKRPHLNQGCWLSAVSHSLFSMSLNVANSTRMPLLILQKRRRGVEQAKIPPMTGQIKNKSLKKQRNLNRKSRMNLKRKSKMNLRRQTSQKKKMKSQRSKTMMVAMTRAMTRAMIRMKPAVTKLEKRKKKSSLKSVTMLRQPRTKTATQKAVSRRSQLAQEAKKWSTMKI